MESTHIRISKELKQELVDCEGQNFTERIKNYNSDNTEQVNTDVNNNKIIEAIKSESNNVNKQLTQQDIENALSSVLEKAYIRDGEVNIV